MGFDTRVAVIGGGQAGLAASYWLKESGVDHIVFERGRPGDTWRRRWDSFCLVTPNWSLRLPGLSYDGDDPDGFMPRDEIVEYVERYHEFVDPPISRPVEVIEVKRLGDRWTVITDRGDHAADAVVVATGSFRTGKLPESAGAISPDIVQIHSNDYRNPSQLPSGKVLVVGSGQSGCQIVDDLRSAGRVTWLSVGSAVRVPRRYRGRDVFRWLDEMGFFATPISDLPEGLERRYSANPQVSGRDGGKDLNLREFGRSGVHLVGRFAGAEGSVIRFAPDLLERLQAADDACRQMEQNLDHYIAEAGLEAPPGEHSVIDWSPPELLSEIDLHEEGITSIVWATGFARDYSWIEGVATDDHGYPIAERGVTGLPGLYFLGLHGMHSIGSGIFLGVGDDANYVVSHVRQRL